MGAKLVVSAVSIILVVGVIIGVVVGVNKNGSSDSDQLSPRMKVIASVCTPTSYKELCMQTLGSTANTTDPKELIKVSVDVVVDYVQRGLNLSQSLLQAANPDGIKWSLENCKKQFEDAMDNLQLALSTIEESDLKSLSERAPMIQNWLNPVVAYSVTCMDEIDDSPAKVQITSHANNVTEVADNALAILGELPKVLASLNVQLNITSTTGRKLLEDEAKSQQYPSWFSAADRKLIARRPVAPRIVPNAVVAQDGTGNFRTLSAALDAYPKGHQGRYVVYVKAGMYKEWYILTKEKKNVYIYGDGARRTVITNNQHVKGTGMKTSASATFSIEANGTIVRDMGFQNTAGPELEQAVALRVKAHMCAFFSIRVSGFQDTLYVHGGLQFYRNCVISGTVDFIFGDASAIIQKSLIIARKARNQNVLTAQGKDKEHETTAIVIHNCKIVPDATLQANRFAVKTYLGRPWKQYATTVFMENKIADFIHPEGYMPMYPGAEKTGYFGEFKNIWPGANTAGRVKWPGFQVMNEQRASYYTVENYLNNKGYSWIKDTGIKYIPGFARPR